MQRSLVDDLGFFLSILVWEAVYPSAFLFPCRSFGISDLFLHILDHSFFVIYPLFSASLSNNYIETLTLPRIGFVLNFEVACSDICRIELRGCGNMAEDAKVDVNGSQSTTTTSSNKTSNLPSRASSDTANSTPEDLREQAIKSAPHGFSNTNPGISVAGAEDQFAQLKRELTGISEKSRIEKASRSKVVLADIEKVASSIGTEEQSEPFDLEATLRGNLEEERHSGIRSKRIGVVWKDLGVTGTGGVTNFVKTFPGMSLGAGRMSF